MAATVCKTYSMPDVDIKKNVDFILAYIANPKRNNKWFESFDFRQMLFQTFLDIHFGDYVRIFWT